MRFKLEVQILTLSRAKTRRPLQASEFSSPVCTRAKPTAWIVARRAGSWALPYLSDIRNRTRVPSSLRRLGFPSIIHQKPLGRLDTTFWEWSTHLGTEEQGNRWLSCRLGARERRAPQPEQHRSPPLSFRQSSTMAQRQGRWGRPKVISLRAAFEKNCPRSRRRNPGSSTWSLQDKPYNRIPKP